MDISPQNLMTTDVSTLLIPQLNGRELVAASRVCKIWYVAITTRETLWEERLEQIKYCGKYTISKDDYPKETSTHYEKWRLLINNFFQKSQKSRLLLSNPLPYEYAVDFTVTGIQYYSIDRSSNRIKLLESAEEAEKLRIERYNTITEISHAFCTDLSLYSCDVQDKSFIHPYIAIEEKEKITLQDTFLLASACFLKEGNPNDFFTLFKFETFRHLNAVTQLVSLSLEQGNCEQALRWIKRYVDVIQKTVGINADLMERFGQQVIREQKIGLLEELFLHLLSLNDPTYLQNELYQRAIKNHINATISRLSDQGHGEIMNSLIKKLHF